MISWAGDRHNMPPMAATWWSVFVRAAFGRLSMTRTIWWRHCRGRRTSAAVEAACHGGRRCRTLLTVEQWQQSQIARVECQKNVTNDLQHGGLSQVMGMIHRLQVREQSVIHMHKHYSSLRWYLIPHWRLEWSVTEVMQLALNSAVLLHKLIFICNIKFNNRYLKFRTNLKYLTSMTQTTECCQDEI